MIRLGGVQSSEGRSFSVADPLELIKTASPLLYCNSFYFHSTALAALPQQLPHLHPFPILAFPSDTSFAHQLLQPPILHSTTLEAPVVSCTLQEAIDELRISHFERDEDGRAGASAEGVRRSREAVQGAEERLGE